MAESYAQDEDALQAFHRWRCSSEAQVPGIGGPDLETICLFVPRSNLNAYFERPRRLEDLLDAVLSREQRPAVDPNYVRDHYLLSFATLLCIGEGRMIHHFQQYKSLRDEKLPHRSQPEDFPFTASNMMEQFRNAQWQFCASSLEYGMSDRFKEEDILPIVRKEKLGEGGSAIIYRIVVDEHYNSLRPRGHVIPQPPGKFKNTFVLKTYRSAEAEQNYKAERDAYFKLRWAGKPSPHIISYYGGFTHGHSYNIILEYADRGTLESFMRNTDPPSSVEDTVGFWNRILDVTHGIMTIHGRIGNDKSASSILTGWHQDVKPANILVFSGDGTSPYDCHFKIADLGLTHFRPSASQIYDPTDLDAFGTRAYGTLVPQSYLFKRTDGCLGAPETFRSHAATESCPLQVTPDVDIWSIGCVLSEVSVWAQYGWNRVVEYRRQRTMEVEDKGGGKGEQIFHFDSELLNAVNNIHADIRRQTNVAHHVTRSVLERLVDDMLLHEGRPTAKFVLGKSKRLIEEHVKRFGVSIPGPMGETSGGHVDIHRVASGTRTPPQIPPEHTRGGSESSSGRNNRSRMEIGFPPGEPLPPGDYFPPSSSPMSQSSPHVHHHQSTSQSSGRRDVATPITSQPGEQGAYVAPDRSPIPHTVIDPDESPYRQLAPQRQEELVRPVLSIDEGHDWKRKKKEKKRSEDAVLPGNENLTNLDQRDHIFLIDNSDTMKQYVTEIGRVVSLLAYMLKDSDRDGLDIHFTQSRQKINSQKSSKLSSSIRQAHFGGITDMRGRLQNVLKEHVNKLGTQISPPTTWFGFQPPPQPQRPLSFYILTDAKWQPTDVGGLIKDLVKRMVDKNCPKDHIAIQFIRFGNDQASIDKLDQLDHGLGLKAMDMDIVDHTYWDGNVWKQLLGALNDWYDDDPPLTLSN